MNETQIQMSALKKNCLKAAKLLLDLPSGLWESAQYSLFSLETLQSAHSWVVFFLKGFDFFVILFFKCVRQWY